MVKETFEEVEGFTPEVTAIHAGLECGVFAQKLPGIDMVSFGPDIQGAHAPGERVRLQSVSRFWDLVLKLLSKLSGSETPAERSEL
jgi:dipeptidase D